MRRLPLVVITLAAAIAPPAALATSWTDPRGDVAVPRADVVAVDATDTAARFTVRIHLAGPLGRPAKYLAMVSGRSGTWLFRVNMGHRRATWSVINRHDAEQATSAYAVRGNALTVWAALPDLGFRPGERVAVTVRVSTSGKGAVTDAVATGHRTIGSQGSSP